VAWAMAWVMDSISAMNSVCSCDAVMGLRNRDFPGNIQTKWTIPESVQEAIFKPAVIRLCTGAGVYCHFAAVARIASGTVLRIMSKFMNSIIIFKEINF
jgi:hypothetical protein